MKAAPIVAAALLPVTAMSAHAQTTPRVGDIHAITRSYETTSETSDGSSGSSSGSTEIVERVIGASSAGIELEYDLPPGTSAEDRAREWQFPARILKPVNGPAQLRNRPEIEARIGTWLKAAGLTRADCGRWIFTWNAFRIECDPQSILATIGEYDLRSGDVREGAPYHPPGTRGPGTLVRTNHGPQGATYTVKLDIDPQAVQLDRAKSDLVVGEITGAPVTLEAAQRERARQQVSGTVSMTFETDSADDVRRRIAVTELKTRHADGKTERKTRTVILERRKL